MVKKAFVILSCAERTTEYRPCRFEVGINVMIDSLSIGKHRIRVNSIDCYPAWQLRHGSKTKALKHVRASLRQQGINIAQAILALLARTTPEAPIPQCHSRQLIATEVMPMRHTLNPQPP